MKFTKPLPTLLAFLGAILIGFTACDSTNNDSTQRSGRFAVQLTDAPGDFDAVFIDIQSVRVHQNEDIEADTTESDEEAEQDGWITLNNEPIRVNLLDLRNGNTIQLGDEQLDAGEYRQIRLILGPDNEVVMNGESFALKTPSAQQSGLKLKFDAVVEDGETYNLLIDFDAARSIVETGNGKFILKPVLRAVELEATGSISGTVQPDSVQTSVMAINNGDTLSTLTGEDGGFAIIGVTQGTYDVLFDPNDEAFADTTIANVSVGVDEDVELGTVTLHQ